MHVETILNRKGDTVYKVRPDQALTEAAEMMNRNRVGMALVCDNGELVGVLSERDIVGAISRLGAVALADPVRRFMSRPVVTCRPGDSVEDVMYTMSSRRIRHLPVVVDGKVLGVVSIGDVIHHRLAETQTEIAVLRDYALATS